MKLQRRYSAHLRFYKKYEILFLIGTSTSPKDWHPEASEMRWEVQTGGLMAGDAVKAEKFINALTGAQTQVLAQIIDKHVGQGMMTIFKNYVSKLFPDESEEVRDPLVHLMLMGYLIQVDQTHNLVKPK
tara:strand:+ start:74 stop:460 length:387 start_codon:yes stop_codon:yes gene_type:complete